MKKIILGLCSLAFLASTYYVFLPSPKFPLPPAEVLQSREPADTESIYRRSYYTNYARSEIMAHYSGQFKNRMQIRLNHPPEEVQTLIRDQAKSNYLEQLVHPLRESLYISGFEPTKPTEQININGIHYANKITVRYIPSGIFSRLTVVGLAVLSVYFLTHVYVKLA